MQSHTQDAERSGGVTPRVLHLDTTPALTPGKNARHALRRRLCGPLRQRAPTFARTGVRRPGREADQPPPLSGELIMLYLHSLIRPRLHVAYPISTKPTSPSTPLLRAIIYLNLQATGNAVARNKSRTHKCTRQNLLAGAITLLKQKISEGTTRYAYGPLRISIIRPLFRGLLVT